MITCTYRPIIIVSYFNIIIFIKINNFPLLIYLPSWHPQSVKLILFGILLHEVQEEAEPLQFSQGYKHSF